MRIESKVNANADRAKLPSPRAMIRDRPRNQAPKFLRVVELSQVTELVDDDVIGKVNGKTRDAIIEVEIPLLRTTPPSRPLIAYRDSVVDETVVLIKNLQAAMHKPPREFFLSVILHVVFHTTTLIVPKIPQKRIASIDLDRADHHLSILDLLNHRVDSNPS
jgi:hypothetical protein